jgi:16S rRNA (cytidine1402-2'-O)-methyltransferase
MSGSLYVVATPIGNLADITLRALDTLKSVGLIAAEDTRRTAILLRHFGINTPTTSLHEHNERQKLGRLVEQLKDGLDIALVSDAGTPVVADPGQSLIAAAIEANVSVIPIPGASAVLSVLSASGFPAEEFVFAGFAPSRANNRRRWLERFALEKRSVVFYEAPHRISATLRDLATIMGDRPIVVGRELTKIHEELIRVARAADLKTEQITEKGEFAVVLGPVLEVNAVQPVDEATIAEYFYHSTNLNSTSKRDALADTARKFGRSTNEVYALLERYKASRPS